MLAITENGYRRLCAAQAQSSSPWSSQVNLILPPNFLPPAEMSTAKALQPPCSSGMFYKVECRPSVASPSPSAEKLGFAMLCGINVAGSCRGRTSLVLLGDRSRSNSLKPIKAKEDTGASLIDDCNRKCSGNWFKPIKAKEDSELSCTDDCAAFSGTISSFQIHFLAGLKSYQDLESRISFCWNALFALFLFCIRLGSLGNFN